MRRGATDRSVSYAQQLGGWKAAVLAIGLVSVFLVVYTTVNNEHILSNKEIFTDFLKVSELAEFKNLTVENIINAGVQISDTEVSTEYLVVNGTATFNVLNVKNIVNEGDTIISTQHLVVNGTAVFKTVNVEAICPAEAVHTTDGELLSTHESQHLENTNTALRITLPADLSDYVRKLFKVYRSGVEGPTHILEIAAGGASWDREIDAYRFLRILPGPGAGVTFYVLDESTIAVVGSSGVTKCRDATSGQTCLPLDGVAYTFAKVYPDDEPPAGSFRWPDANGDATTTQSKRGDPVVVPQIAVFPTPRTGVSYPPAGAIEFDSATSALNALAGTVVQNTTIYFEPGTYHENLLIDGFMSGADFSGSSALPNPRSIQPRGLILVGDPRILMGSTWVDCATNYLNQFSEVSEMKIFGVNPNSIIPISSTTVEVLRCPVDSQSHLVNKLSCTSTSGPNFEVGGVVEGDVVMIYDRPNGEYHKVTIVSAASNTVTFNLTGSGLTDISTVFPTTITQTSQCGSSFTLMPNRIIEGVGNYDEDDSASGKLIHSPISILAINEPVTMMGFWIKRPTTGNRTLYSMTVAARANIMSTVIDNSSPLSNTWPRVFPFTFGHIHVDVGGYLTNQIMSIDFVSTNTTSIGQGTLIRRYQPLTMLGGEQSGFRMELSMSGGDARLHALTIVSAHSGIEIGSAHLFLLSGSVFVATDNPSGGTGLTITAGGIVDGLEKHAFFGFKRAVQTIGVSAGRLGEVIHFDLQECAFRVAHSSKISMSSTNYPDTVSDHALICDIHSPGASITIDGMNNDPYPNRPLLGAGNGYNNLVYMNGHEVRYPGSNAAGNLDIHSAITIISGLINIPCDDAEFMQGFIGKSYCVSADGVVARTIQITAPADCPNLRFPGGTCTATMSNANTGICFTVFATHMWVTHEEGVVTYGAC